MASGQALKQAAVRRSRIKMAPEARAVDARMRELQERVARLEEMVRALWALPAHPGHEPTVHLDT